jgi:hypothetical protein
MPQGRAHAVRLPRASRPLRGALCAAVALAISGIATRLGAADDGAPRPNVAAPDNPLLQNLRTTFSGLNDASPVVRERAQRKLMTLRRADLEALRAVVQERLPLTPAEAEGLRDIVTHVFLSASPYEMDPSRGFLGVVRDPEQLDGFEELETGGIEVRHRIPGFCAYRYFEDGDVILSVGNAPGFEIHSFADMTHAVTSFSAGTTVPFAILRRGRIVRLAVVLDAVPKDLQPAMVPDFLANRNKDAQDYWDAQFQPLVGD